MATTFLERVDAVRRAIGLQQDTGAVQVLDAATKLMGVTPAADWAEVPLPDRLAAVVAALGLRFDEPRQRARDAPRKKSAAAKVATRANPNATSSSGAADDLLAIHRISVDATLDDLLRIEKKLPTAVAWIRVRWTVALALAAAIDGELAGDFVECGVFRGGTSLAMMRVLDRLNSARLHYACDSFQGVPPPSAADAVSSASVTGAACRGTAAGAGAFCSRARGASAGRWKATRADFEGAVSRFGLRSERLRIVPGWFSETLPPSGLGAIASCASTATCTTRRATRSNASSRSSRSAATST